MPIYAYKCAACGFAKDVLQKLSDPLLTGCPTCGAQTFQKQLTAAGFQLKGSGWYATDFKGGGAPASGEDKSDDGGDKPKAEATEGKAESKSETKADSKTESKPESKSADTPAVKKADPAPSAGA